MWQSVGYYKALSNSKRLAILKVIQQGEKTVGEIGERLHLRQANVSQHLMLLRQAGIIDKRRKGKNIYYHLQKSA